MPKEKKAESSPRAYKPMSENDALCGGCQGTGWATHEMHHHPKTKENIWHQLQDKEGNRRVKPCTCRRGDAYRTAYDKAMEDVRAGKCR